MLFISFFFPFLYEDTVAGATYKKGNALVLLSDLISFLTLFLVGFCWVQSLGPQSYLSSFFSPDPVSAEGCKANQFPEWCKGSMQKCLSCMKSVIVCLDGSSPFCKLHYVNAPFVKTSVLIFIDTVCIYFPFLLFLTVRSVSQQAWCSFKKKKHFVLSSSWLP